MRKRGRRKGTWMLLIIVPAALLIAGTAMFFNKNHAPTVHAAEHLDQVDDVLAGTSVALDTPDTPVAPETPPLPPVEAQVLSSAIGNQSLLAAADIARLHHTYIPAGTIFSFREWLAQEGSEHAEQSLDAWEYPMSLFYEAAIRAGLETVERHTGMTMSPLAAPGFDVSLTGSRHDLRVYNALPFDIWVSVSASRNEISLLGQKEVSWQAPQIEVMEERFKPETMLLQVAGDGVNYRPRLAAEGVLVKVYRIDQGEKTLLYKDFYAPIPKMETMRAEREASIIVERMYADDHAAAVEEISNIEAAETSDIIVVFE